MGVLWLILGEKGRDLPQSYGKIPYTTRTKSITPILTCESHLFQPWNFHMWSRENFNMQIKLKLCQIWRVEKFHTWKFQAWKFHT